MTSKRKYILTALGFVVIGLLVGVILTTSFQLPAPGISEETSGAIEHSTTGSILPTTARLSKVIDEVLPSVVTITSTKVIQTESFFPDDFFRNSPFGKRFFHFEFPQQKREYTERGLGSGVIISADGYIITNYHVVKGADEIKVRIGKKRYEAELIGSDQKTDLAVLKIDKTDLKPANLGNSDGVAIGEWVIAIGSPFQFEHTVTLGIISAKGRANVGVADYEDFLQTDAAINPGNSGGALVNLNGEVIGINTAIFSRTGGFQGIGFAIPINMAKRVKDLLITKGKVVRGWIGIMIQDVNDELAAAVGMPEPKGVIVSEVLKDAPGEKAGLKVGDIILELNDKEFSSGRAFRNSVAGKIPGTKVTLTVLRDGKKKKFTIILGELPSDGVTAIESKESQGSKKKIGLTVEPLTNDLAEQLDYVGSKGVIVSTVESGSPADKAGIKIYDLIQKINDTVIENMDDFRDALSKIRDDKPNLILIRRGNSNLFLTLNLENSQ